MDNNFKFKSYLKNVIKFNYMHLDKLSKTDRLAVAKISTILNEYNEDIPYKTLMIYIDDPIKLLSKINEYILD